VEVLKVFMGVTEKLYIDSFALDGSGFEPQERRDILYRIRIHLGPTQPPVQWVPVFYRGKPDGAWH
jgi:hypothetical protein